MKDLAGFDLGTRRVGFSADDAILLANSSLPSINSRTACGRWPSLEYGRAMTEPRQPDVLSRLPIPEEVRDDVMEMLRVGPSAVWGRPVLSRRERSLATIAMMTALGNEFAIREHVIMGLDSFGLSREEICEVMIQAAIYAGFPAAMKAFDIATDIFAERDAAD